MYNKTTVLILIGFVGVAMNYPCPLTQALKFVLLFFIATGVCVSRDK